MRSALFAGLFSSIFLTHVAWADGLIYQLPADGATVRYDTETTSSFNGQERTFKGSINISSVGEATVDGEKCRWIEFRTMTKQDDQERIVILKFLIPEKHLGRGKSPSEHIIRGWVKQADSEPQAVTDFKSVPGSGRFFGYLGGPPQNPGELEKVDIDCPLGKLACPAVTGSHDFDMGNGTTFTTSYEKRLHEKSPFGVVSTVSKFERKTNGRVAASGTTKLTLADTGTTALSELPDKN